jgi:hypothetical protein
VFVGQLEHAPFSTAEPAGHTEQEVAPTTDVDPGAHGAQLVEELEELYVFAAQGLHEPLTTAEPAGHTTHVV